MSHFIFNIFKMWYLCANKKTPHICGTGGKRVKGLNGTLCHKKQMPWSPKHSGKFLGLIKQYLQANVRIVYKPKLWSFYILDNDQRDIMANHMSSHYHLDLIINRFSSYSGFDTDTDLNSKRHWESIVLGYSGPIYRGYYIFVVGEEAFDTRAPELWSKLPLNIRTIRTLQYFKQTLKTHLRIPVFI